MPRCHLASGPDGCGWPTSSRHCRPDTHTPLGERGLRLSAGQRQRIALARVYLRDPPLLLLDEPAAHLDPANARQIGTAIDTVLADRTVILVSHGRGWDADGCSEHPPRPREN